MELMVVISLLLFSFFALQTPCASLQIQPQSSNEQGNGVQLSLPTLPRKLRFAEELVQFKANGAQHTISNAKQKDQVSGKAYEKEVEGGRMQGSRGTRQQQWVEGPDISQYFTMDYSNVRRRRPIHNKSLPVAP